MTAPTTTAHAVRTTRKRAADAFATGARVLVSTSSRTLIPVGPSTTTHSAESTTWAALVAQVAVWVHRDGPTAFFIVQEATPQV